MEIRMYMRMLQRGWWIIILASLIALNAALAASYLATPVYEAAARFVVSPKASMQGDDFVSSLNTLDKRSIVNTYVEFLNSGSIHADVINQLAIDPVAPTRAQSPAG